MSASPFRKIIIRLNNYTFANYKNTSYIGLEIKNPKLIAEYKIYEQELIDLLSQTKYWHGTGLYQYQITGESKYNGVNHTKILNVLETILSNKALVPNYDPWFEKYIHSSKSISLANQWFYGKMYAHYHLNENDSLQYEIAPINFWYKMFIWIQLTEHYCKSIFGYLILYIFSPSLQKQGRVWMSTFRSDVDKNWPPWKILTAKSDIPNNFSILFGIKDEIETIKVMPYASLFETRTTKPMPLSKCTFVAVPYTNIEYTKKLLIKQNINLKIIPLEYLELQMSKNTLYQIITNDYK
jgi:hypothetical protein